MSYPRSAFGQALRQIAQLAKSDVGLEIAFAETGNWDHHVNEGSTQGLLAARLDDFARGLAALVTDLGDRMRETVVLTMSEFGRTVAENGNRGTDHGHGNAMMVIGAGVKGGRVYGRWPGLSQDALLRGPRSSGDDGLPRRVRGGRHQASRREGCRAHFPRLRAPAGESA